MSSAPNLRLGQFDALESAKHCSMRIMTCFASREAMKPSLAICVKRWSDSRFVVLEVGATIEPST